MVQTKPQLRCSHCGGVLNTSEDIVTCLMCGRSAEHKCDLCMFLPGKKAAVPSLKKTKPVKKSGSKKAAAVR